jgi:hypothetical protein
LIGTTNARRVCNKGATARVRSSLRKNIPANAQLFFALDAITCGGEFRELARGPNRLPEESRDECLLWRARRGDEPSLLALYERHHAVVFRFASRLLDSHAAAKVSQYATINYNFNIY